LVAIANADDDEIASEVELLKSIMEEWEIEMSEVAGDDGEEEDTDDDSEEDEEEKKLNQLLSKYGVDSESDLTSITVEQAKELSGYKGYVLDLSGLTSLSEKLADILAKHKGNLMLDGLTTISDKALEFVASHSGGYLSLDGLTNLSDKALQILSLHKELLYLNGLTSMSDKAVSVLSKQQGSLVLDGLTDLSEKAIVLLASHQGGFLSLDGLTSLSDKSLEALANHDGDLYLNGLTSLSDKACQALANHKDELSLNGVTTLSEKAAIALSKHEGELSLDGLTSLSDKAAAALAVKGISISEEEESEEEEDIDYCQYDLSDLDVNDDKVAIALSKHEGELSLDGLTSISDKAAEVLAEKGISISQEEESEEEEDIDYSQYDFSDLDVNDDKVVDKICLKIKKEKCLTTLLYVNKVLEGKGVDLDADYHAYFFISDIDIKDQNFSNEHPFLLVNMDGFYSNINDKNELNCILSWDQVEDMNIISWSPNNQLFMNVFGKKGGSFIEINLPDRNFIRMGNHKNNSMKILYEFYKNVWKPINERFKDESMISWDEVWEMGIKDLGFDTPENYFNLINL
jgi:hypothetical protein